MELSLERIADLPDEALAPALAHLAALTAAVTARMSQRGAQAPTEPEGWLLDVEEAAKRLGVSRDVLYSSKALKPLRRRIGRRVLFSEQAISAWIGRATDR